MKIYQQGMLCKHYKGTNLLEKNIYQIKAIDVIGTNVDETLITYTGSKDLKTASGLVIYSNIFQNGKLFAREYEELVALISFEKQALYHQKLVVEPLTSEELVVIKDEEFIRQKLTYTKKKYHKK